MEYRMLKNNDLILGIDLGGTNLSFRLEAPQELLASGSMATSRNFSTQLTSFIRV